MVQEAIALVVGFVVSVLAETIPGFKEKWSEWKWKRASLLGLFLVVPLGAWLLSCIAELTIPGTYLCTTQGVFDTVIMGLVAFAGSQSGYLMVARQSFNARLRHTNLRR
jgi:hypothetical protein